MLNESFDEVHITSINYERACSIIDLKQIADKISLTAFVEDDPIEFVDKFGKEDGNNCIGGAWKHVFDWRN